MKYILIVFFSFILLIEGFSQENILFNGKILGINGFVYNVNVINLSSYQGTTSDIEGNFELYVSKNDTIKFSCVGYKSYFYAIPLAAESNLRVIVKLVEDTVMIGETVITPWPVNRTLLKEAFLDESKQTKEPIAAYAGFREIEGDPTPPAPTILNPISFVANIFSKKRIQEKKMARIRRILQEE